MGPKNSPKERRKSLAEQLRRREIDWVLISNPKHIFYFTGYSSNLNPWGTVMKGARSTSFLAVDDEGGGHLLLGTSELVNPFLGKDVTDVDREKVFDGPTSTYVDCDIRLRLMTFADVLSKELKTWLTGQGLPQRTKRIGIEDWHLASAYREAVSEMFDESHFEGISDALLQMRRTKGADEIAHIRDATALIETGYKIVKNNIDVGRTEIDLFALMNHGSFKKYGPLAQITGDIVSGERIFNIGGPPTERKLKKGDNIVLDLQAASDNYWSDLRRTFVVGKLTREKERAFKTLRRAKTTGERMLRPGTRGEEIYEAVSLQLVRDGYPPLVHHAGHALGLDDQEPPWFIPGEKMRIEEGSVVVIEIGIYPKEAGGMGIEDLYVITKSGFEKVSKFPLSLT